MFGGWLGFAAALNAIRCRGSDGIKRRDDQPTEGAPMSTQLG
jgi:hypothetical protein